MKLNISKIFILCISGSHLLHAGLIEDINNGKRSLQGGKQQISDAATELNNTYEMLNKEVIQEAQNALNEANAQSKQVTEALQAVNDIPDFMGLVKQVAGIGDLPNAIVGVARPLQTIQNTLEPLKKSFEQANERLNPKTDPLAVYKNFTESQVAFDKAVAGFDELVEALKDL